MRGSGPPVKSIAPPESGTMDLMRLWRLFLIPVFSIACLAESPKTSETSGAVIRGKLTRREGKPPALQTADGKLVTLAGDTSTLGVLNDKRLANAELEAKGRFSSNGVFTVDPIHTRAMHVHKDGKKLAITYWCDVCSIRTYTPGLCWCCQQDTALDLRDPDKE